MDKDEFENAIQYFQSIINNNYSQQTTKIGATFIGINMDI
jgi:hypothetical protein